MDTFDDLSPNNRQDFAQNVNQLDFFEEIVDHLLTKWQKNKPPRERA